ncbi:DUF6443 domain-containing protein [Psychroserpens sp.]|uniref:DUF6443 domain-containing protein n=1 Tax=Psychroserpens sp. TaxID=2020870 RepID=UPI002B2722A7|nr:DUF6443 domain-containing protein [Psychroserpens sp.]
MKNSIYILISILLPYTILAQTTTENHVQTTTYQVETTDGINKAGTTMPLIQDDKIESITYFDGLGRPIQSISKHSGSNKQDIIVPFEYDAIGRQVFDYLPYADEDQVLGTGNLNYRNHNQLLLDLEGHYAIKYTEDIISSGEINAYSEKRFEASPLNRILEQAAPGKDWSMNENHTIKLDYLVNKTSENIRHFIVNHPGGNMDEANLAYNGIYKDGELYKAITKDENWETLDAENHTTEEFKNKQGQIVLKRTYETTDIYDTYYVYDNFGNLTFVISPEGSENILDSNDNVIQSALDDLCYQYHYDSRNRLIEKKIPQKGWEYIVYDMADHPILTQDANLRTNNDWLFTKYDKFDRVIYTGKHHFVPNGGNDNSGRIELQNDVNTEGNYSEPRLLNYITVNGTDIYYDNKIIPKVDIDIYTINYYDDYQWDTQDSFEASYELEIDANDGLVETGNVVEKPDGAVGGWNAGFETTATIGSDGYIQWTASQTDKGVMVGLSKTSSAPDNNYTSIDYAVFLRKNFGYFDVYEEGVVKYSSTSTSSVYSVGDVFKVERYGNQITYYRNNIAFYTSSDSSTSALIGDSSFFDSGTKIENVFIGYTLLNQPFALNTKGLSTGGKVRILDTNKWTVSTSSYDTKGRPIHSVSRNDYLTSLDALSSYLDFSGKVIRSINSHATKFSPLTIVVNDEFRYDHTGRLIRHEQAINNSPFELIAKNNYDELGQLTKKYVGGELHPSPSSSYANEVGVSTSTDIINSTASGWGNSGLSTTNSISGDGYITFETTDLNKLYIAGLSYTDTNQHWNTIDYGIRIFWNGVVSIREGGVSINNVETTHFPGDKFSVERRGTTVYYLKNGEPFYVSGVQTTNAPMIGDLSIYSLDTNIKDFNIIDLESGLQEVDYTYNIRGWLKTINDVNDLRVNSAIEDMFAFKINYNTNELDGTPLYNGNISETLWKTTSVDPNNQEYANKRGYDYTYDALNRIKSADYHKLLGVNQNDYYNLNSITYDKNGNILTLAREGHTDDNNPSTFATMDNLNYYYNGNQLHSVTDNTIYTTGFNDGNISDSIYNNSDDDYLYDVNGNMITDNNKDITITYNHLNLPVSVTQTGGDIVTYKYDATGVKLSKAVTVGSSTSSTQYINNFIYKDSSLEFFSHPEGYVELNGSGGFDYVYQYKDHLGNIRLAYSDIDNNGSIEVSKSEILEENNYYPFGLKHKGYNNVINGTDHKWGFLNQEENDELGLGWLTFRYRNYMPEIGRFFGIDPISEDFYTITNYQFAHNNPVWKVELEGLEGAITTPNAIDVVNQEFVPPPVSSDLGGANGTPADTSNPNYLSPINNYDSSTNDVFTWADSDLTGNNTFGAPRNTNCANLACAQANELGTDLAGQGSTGEVTIANRIEVYNAGTDELLNSDDAINYINSELENGNAVVVGVDYSGGSNTDNLGTDHYVTVVGRDTENGQGFFFFIENAVGSEANATNFTVNRLTPNTGNSNLSGTTTYHGNSYETTRVQRNEQENP